MTPTKPEKEWESAADPDGGAIYRHLWTAKARAEAGFEDESPKETAARLARQAEFYPWLKKEKQR